jgi:hypothetical protein
VRLGDRLIKVRPVSPLSKAKDLEDVQVTQQVLNLAQNIAAVVQACRPSTRAPPSRTSSAR